jgi:arsenate reductase
MRMRWAVRDDPLDQLDFSRPMPDLVSINPNPELALQVAGNRLKDELGAVFGAETVERYLQTSYDYFAGSATVATYLPVIAEKFARQRLKAVAKVGGFWDARAPVVLFLCTSNSARSQMALGWFNHLAGDRATAWSGGAEPDFALDPVVVEAMAEVGIDLTGELPKPWTTEIVRAADVVVSMGCGDACPVFPSKRYDEWTIPDPAGKPLDQVRPIRDEIGRRVQRLLAQLEL